ncbi:MAG: F0F1 ATP synthase subunit B [Alphaproteobacteria bacterium]
MGKLKRMAKVPENWLLVAAFAFVIAGSSITEDANFWILIAFVTFIGVFGRKAWSAIKKALDGRRDKIQADLDEAQRLREEAQGVLAEYERKRREAEDEALQMIEHAKAEAERHADDAKRALEETMRRREEAAMQRIQQAESDALREVRDTAAALAVKATAQLIRENLDEARADAMIERSIREMSEKLH